MTPSESGPGDQPAQLDSSTEHLDTTTTALRATAVVVVNFGSSALLRRNLVPLAVSCPELLVVVVDNHSDDAEDVRIGTLCTEQGWSLVSQRVNLGFGGGMNLGVAAAIAAGRSVLVMLNPDATISRDALAALSTHVQSDPSALVAPKILRSDGTTWFAGASLDMRRGRVLSRPVAESVEVPWLTGACLAIGADLWERVGGFDERYFLYWEDVDLSVRVRGAGGVLEVRDDITAVHDEGGTQKRGSSTTTERQDFSRQYYFFNIRNRLLFAGVHLDTRSRLRWYLHTPTESYRILLRGIGKRKFLRPWDPVWLAVSASFDGWRAGRNARRSDGRRS